jgi:O-Antigen ligase
VSPEVLRWIDGGRSSIVVALAVALLVPSINVVGLDGLPLDSPWELAAFALLAPFVLSAALREALANLLGRRASWGPRAVFVAVVMVVVAKLLLLGFGSDRGFVGCYASTWKPPESRCEASYSNLFERHDGATRVDETIDFGSSSQQASELVQTYDTFVYTAGAARTDWNLSFSNDLRFNEGVEATNLHELIPFTASWEGTAAIPDDGMVEVTYIGSGAVEVGGSRISLPMSRGSRTVRASVPAGDQPLHAELRFPDGASFAEFRILSQSGAAIAAAEPAALVRVVAGLVWLVLAAILAALALVALSALGRDLWLLATVVIATVAVAVLAGTDDRLGFQYLTALLAPVIVWLTPRRPILWGYAALLVIAVASMVNTGAGIDSVLYRAVGTDFLTYESFARDIVLGHSLSGGEEVFYYQPGSRYVLGLLHLLFGDGDVLVTWWSMVGLSLPFVALIAWQRQRVSSLAALAGISAAGFLLLAVLNSPTILSLVAMSASEVPSWALLALAVAAPQIQPRHRGGWIGSGVAAALIWVVRNNQAIAALTILAAIAAGLWRRRKHTLVLTLAAAVAVALLPALHNLEYGQQLVLGTTSNAPNQELSLSDLGQVFSDSLVGSELRGHISAIFYDPPTPGLARASLGWLLWGLLALWVAAVAMALSRVRRRDFSLRGWLLLFVPVAYLGLHVIYQVEVYYPRHILAGYLAMGLGAIGAFAELSTTQSWPWRYSYGGRAALWGWLAGAPPRARAMLARLLRRPRAALGGRGPFRLDEALGLSWATEFGWTRVGLIGAAFLAPFSATRFIGSLTLGRAAALTFAALLALDLVRARPRSFRLQTTGLLLAAAYIGLCGWILLNSAAWGCNCDGKAGGFYEFAMIGLLALVAIGFEPRLRGVAMAATLGGLVLAASLALLGVGSLNSGTIDLTQTGGRLSGTFGNANELGFAAALGLPIALAYVSVPRRVPQIAAAGSTLILVATLVLTYSRGAIIAAGVGAIALALWQAKGSRRRVAIVLAAAAAGVLIAGALYAVFERERQDVSFDSVPPAFQALDQRDLSGWDSRALGPVPNGPSELSNRGSAIVVGADRAGEGASFRWGEASDDGTYTLRFRARADRDGLPFSYSLGDRPQARGPVAAGELDRRWREFRLEWSPGQRSAHATLYLWLRAAPASVSLSDAEVIAREPGGPARLVAIPASLDGSLYDRLDSEATREEGRYIDSRLDAADLAFRAFRAEPLRGIGWSTFPDYSEAHLDYGQLAAHNQYLAVAAELGIVGLVLFGMLIAAVVLGVRGSGSGRAEAAAIGVLCGTAAGLVFVEALPVPQLSITIAIAAAIVCARRRGVRAS